MEPRGSVRLQIIMLSCVELLMSCWSLCQGLSQVQRSTAPRTHLANCHCPQEPYLSRHSEDKKFALISNKYDTVLKVLVDGSLVAEVIDHDLLVDYDAGLGNIWFTACNQSATFDESAVLEICQAGFKDRRLVYDSFHRRFLVTIPQPYHVRLQAEIFLKLSIPTNRRWMVNKYQGDSPESLPPGITEYVSNNNEIMNRGFNEDMDNMVDEEEKQTTLLLTIRPKTKDGKRSTYALTVGRAKWRRQIARLRMLNYPLSQDWVHMEQTHLRVLPL